MSLFNLAGKPPAHLRDPATNTELAPPPRRPNYATTHPDAKPAFAVAPLQYSGPPAEAFVGLKAALAELPGVSIAYERAPEYIWATCASKLMGFVDDLELHLSADNGGTRVDVRSAARLGMRDFGVNRKRVEALRELFQGAP